MSDKNLVWFLNNGDCYDSLRELIFINDSQVGDTVFYGEKCYLAPTRFINAHHVQVHITTIVKHLLMEFEFDELHHSFAINVSDEAEQELSELLNSWYMKHLNQYLYTIHNTKEYVVTEADMMLW